MNEFNLAILEMFTVAVSYNHSLLEHLEIYIYIYIYRLRYTVWLKYGLQCMNSVHALSQQLILVLFVIHKLQSLKNLMLFLHLFVYSSYALHACTAVSSKQILHADFIFHG